MDTADERDFRERCAKCDQVRKHYIAILSAVVATLASRSIGRVLSCDS